MTGAPPVSLAEAIREAFSAASLPLSDRQARAFTAHAELMLRWNRTHNLTRIVEPVEIARRHFLDSAAVLDHVDAPSGALTADIGSGAGFPGLAVAAYRPDLRVRLFESSSKKASFLMAALPAVGSGNVQVEHTRLTIGASIADGGAYDLILSRYTSSLEWLGRLSRRMLKSGGWLAAHKFDNADEREALARFPAEFGARIVEWRSDARLDARRRFALAQF